jgi:hypothetical protein
MSTYQASSKTLTFWVVAIVFFVTTPDQPGTNATVSLGRFLCGSRC